MNITSFCDPLHHPCEVDYVSDVDRIAAIADVLRDKAKGAWSKMMSGRNDRAWEGWRRYHTAHHRAIRLWARKSGEFGKTPYAEQIKDQRSCAANWLMYCLNDLRIRGGTLTNTAE